MGFSTHERWRGAALAAMSAGAVAVAAVLVSRLRSGPGVYLSGFDAFDPLIAEPRVEGGREGWLHRGAGWRGSERICVTRCRRWTR